MKKYIRILTLAILLLATMCTLTACGGKSKADASAYMSVEFSGLDGRGTARARFDNAAFEYAVMSQWKEKDRTYEKLANLTLLESSFEVKLDKTEGLSNGDKVTVTLTYSEERAKNAGCKISGLSKTFVVEGLKEPVPVDPFDPSVFNTEDGVFFEIRGISPLAELEIRRNIPDDAAQKYVFYSVDKDKNIANGDVITVTAELIGWGVPEEIYLTQTETTITVEGLNSYITDVSMLKPDDLAKLQEVVRLNFKNQMGTWNNRLHMSSTTVGHDRGMVMGMDNKIGNCSDLRFSDKGYTASGYDQYVLVPFHVDVAQLGSRIWDGVETEEETFRDFNNCAGAARFKNLVLDVDGNLIKDADKNNKEDIYDCFDGFFRVGGAGLTLFEDESQLHEAIQQDWFNMNLTEGTFVR